MVINQFDMAQIGVLFSVMGYSIDPIIDFPHRGQRSGSDIELKKMGFGTDSDT